MKKFLIAILILIVFVACRNDGYNFNIQTNGKIILIDSTLVTNNLESYNPEFVQSGYFPIYYIGNKKDTISLRKNSFENDDFTFPDTIINIFRANSGNISINVDTNFRTSVDVKFKHFFQQTKLEQIDSIYCYDAYPFFVNNLSDSSIFIGHGKVSIENVYLQAINEDGIWVDIEKPYHYSCSNDLHYFVLLPKQIMIGKLIRKRGNYKTNCRLKFKVKDNIIYSNIFKDWIDKRQLKIDFGNSYEK